MLLLAHARTSLPVDVLSLEGRLSWRLTAAEAAAAGTVVTDADMAGLAPWGFEMYASGVNRSLTRRRKKVAPNIPRRVWWDERAALRRRMLQWLSLLPAQHVFLNLSEAARHILAHPIESRGGRQNCPDPSLPGLVAAPTHHKLFARCIGELLSRPEPRMAAELAQIVGRLPRRFVAVHIRTQAADMVIPPSAATGLTRADLVKTLQLQAFDNNVSTTGYSAAVAALCRRAGAALYVASDSRNVADLFARICSAENTSVVHSGCGKRLHSDPLVNRRQGANLSGANLSGAHCTMLDWLVLRSAPHVVRWGMPISSFPLSAVEAGCFDPRAEGKRRLGSSHFRWRPHTSIVHDRLHRLLDLDTFEAVREWEAKLDAAGTAFNKPRTPGCTPHPRLDRALRDSPMSGSCSIKAAFRFIRSGYFE